MKNFFLCNLLALIIIGFSPIHAKAVLSNEVQGLKSLYEELRTFKDDPYFHKVGFGVCCRFNKWMLKVETFRSKFSGIEPFLEVGFVPGDLLQLGMEYMRSRGRPTEYSVWMENIIKEGFENVKND